MFSPLIEIIIDYVAAVAVGVIAAFFLKGYFTRGMENKIREYQADVVESHGKILELEELNEKLEKRLEEATVVFDTDRISMN